MSTTHAEQYRPRTPDGRPKTEHVYDFLRANAGDYFGPAAIAEATGLEQKQVANALRQLERSKRRAGVEHDAYGAYTWRDPGPQTSGLPWAPPTAPTPKRHHPPVAGGFDGLVLAFGDDCDANTLGTILGPVIDTPVEDEWIDGVYQRGAYTVTLTLADGEELHVRGIETRRNSDGFLAMRCRLWDEETGETLAEYRTFDFDEVVGIYVY